MRWSIRVDRIKVILILAALLISVVSLVISHFLAHDLAKEEKLRMEVWAEAMRSLNAADEHTDLNLVLKVINENHTIPVVVLDGNGDALTWRNLQLSHVSGSDSISEVSRLGKAFKARGNAIRIALGDRDSVGMAQPSDYVDVCYGVSSLLKRITIYPYVQLCVVVVFIFVVLLALIILKQAEQNRVWVGLSREAAHQLGTPISSMMAWLEILKGEDAHSPILPEMENDVQRLQLVADRFSKIGSKPELENADLVETANRVVAYMKQRSPDRLTWQVESPGHAVMLNLNARLFEWALENLTKNAVDAMGESHGRITLNIKEYPDQVALDVADTGCGIRKQDVRHVFTPGFSSKQRGWGLGLSLTKRIIEVYHHGRIWVSWSEEGRGTTFRIMLRKDGRPIISSFRRFVGWRQ